MSPREKRPSAMPGHTVCLYTHCGKIFVTVNRHPGTGRISEVFCRFGKAGGCGSAVMDGMTRMISYGLRSGMEPEDIIKGLEGIGCQHGKETCANALATAVKLIMVSDFLGVDPNDISDEDLKKWKVRKGGVTMVPGGEECP